MKFNKINQKIKHKIYKCKFPIDINMYPSDPNGSLDDFILISVNNILEAFSHERYNNPH